MTYALIIVSRAGEQQAWPDELHKVLYKMPLPEGVTRLNESAWLVRLDSCLIFLARLIQLAYDEKLPHHVLFFQDKPAFVSALASPA